MNKLSVICLVDLENIGTRALVKRMEKHPADEYIVFYSESTSTPETLLVHIPENVSVRFIGCRTGTNNAMDFCICTVAGQESLNRYKRIIILSDDKGYDAILPVLHCQGVRVSRETVETPDTSNISDTSNTSGGTPDWRENIPIIKAIRKYVPKEYQDDAIRLIPGVVSYSEAHEMLQAILPPKQVQRVYHKLKPHIPIEAVHR